MAVSSLVAASGGVTMKVAEFTTSGTWTAPSNCTAAEVFVVGGGGGGGAVMVTSQHAVGGGGGGGGVVKGTFPVTAGASYTVTVGSGGTGGTVVGTSSITNAVNGGSSSFGSLVTAYGGTGGSSLDVANVGSSQRFNTPTFGPGPGAGATAGSTSGHVSAGGGGGAGLFVRPTHTGSGGYAPDNNITTSYNVYPTPFSGNKSLQGTPGKNAQATGTSSGFNYVLGHTMGGYGVDGYGGGGGGGYTTIYSTSDMATSIPFVSLGTDGGGNGALPAYNTSGIGVNGGNATANTGGGGGGAAAKSTDGNYRSGNGGNGAAGYVKIVYWS